MTTATKPLKGLSCSILTTPGMGDCSNGGISAVFDNVVLVGDGIPEVTTVTDPRKAVVIDTITFGGKTYFHADPKDLHDKNVWTMAGGAFIWTCDSRFPFDYPIALHDRVEG